MDSNSDEIKNPSHTHPLIRKKHKELIDCDLCQNSIPSLLLLTSFQMYSCHVCGLTICQYCVKEPFLVDPERSHEHHLNLFTNLSLSCTCLACGVSDLKTPLCVCIPCCFIIHRDCVDLPRVIYINRHDHRISHLYSLLVKNKKLKCRVCRKDVDKDCGAYSCSTCPDDYVVHSKCAINREIWDGKEMEDVPDEEDPIELIPFKEITKGLIKHFSHEHNLKLIVGHESNKHCNACSLEIYFLDLRYECEQEGCGFVLHEICANLLKKRRHPSYPSRLILLTKTSILGVFQCRCCNQFNNGFAYVGLGITKPNIEFKIDVRCGSIRDGFIHKSHPHGELDLRKSDKVCSSCEKIEEFTLNCCECESFRLCFSCATLPYEVKHKYDQHFLTLCYGENTLSKSIYWCEICETKLDSEKWFYKCEECCTTLHINCVLGRTPYVRFGSAYQSDNIKWEVMVNDSASRPICHRCCCRCQDPLIFKTKEFWLCSFHCLTSASKDYYRSLSYMRKEYENSRLPPLEYVEFSGIKVDRVRTAVPIFNL